ncbi:MAG: hypothetical protein HKN23_17660 [Verrucomicrobiales bacterium]|nr:hypothetical protein [Verrucomicrobiales bacterium]
MSFALLSTPTKKHEVLIENLKPGTKYFVSVIGLRKDNGPIFFPLMNKKFTTRDRKLDIRFTKIEMLDDSDDLSPGEFRFGFFGYDGKLAKLINPDPIFNLKYGEVSIGSDDNLKINLAHTMTFNKESLRLDVTGAEDDDDTLTSAEKIAVFLTTGVIVPETLPRGGLAVGPHAGTGENSALEWATARQTFSFPNVTNIDSGNDPWQRETYRIKFALHANPNKVDLEVKIHGFIDVYYQ